MPRAKNLPHPATVVVTALTLLMLGVAGCGPRQPGADGARNAGAEAVVGTAISEDHAEDHAEADAATGLDRTRQELAAANAAFQAGRLTSPEGDNALAYLLAVIEREPDHRGAFELLVDLTPIVASTIEAQIAVGELEPAASALALLDQASPDSLIVQSLQRKLDGARQRAAAQPSRQAAAGLPVLRAAPLPLASGAANAPAEVPAERVLAAAETVPTSVATGTTTTTGPAPRARSDEPAPPVPAAALLVATSEPVAISKPAPQYPDAARKRRTEGWVDLQFTVNADGAVDAVEVISAQPSGVFERSAERAVQRWRFKPAERDGKAVPARVRTRVGFRLG